MTVNINNTFHNHVVLLHSAHGWKIPSFFFAIYNVVPQNVSVQLVPKTSIIMVYGRYIELVSGVYKSTFTSLGGTTL